MRTITGLLLTLGCCFGQSFEVASIKPSPPESRGMNVSTDPGRFTAQNATLKFLIQVAYHVREDQISGGPGWLDSARYDVVATKAGEDDSRVMLQSLLADRFHLKLHSESRTRNAYQLTVGKGGLKLSPTEPAGEGAKDKGGASVGRGKITARKVSMVQLAEMLSNVLRQTVTDATGTSGVFDLKLEWTPDESQPMPAKPGVMPAAEEPRPSADSAGPSIFTALQEQLGLKLEARKVPVETLVIDSAEFPRDN